MYLDGFLCRLDTSVFIKNLATRRRKTPHFESCKCESWVRKNKRGGRRAVYVNECFTTTINHSFLVINADCECLVLHLDEIIIVTTYRSPLGCKKMFLDLLDELFDYLSSLKYSFVIMGDVNVDIASESSCANDLRHIISTYGSSNMIRVPTHVSTKSESSLDVSVIDLGDSDILAGVLPCDISTHLLVSCLLPNVSKKKRKKATRVENLMPVP